MFLLFALTVGTWCVRELEDFSHIFDSLTSFDEDISRWDVSSATSMAGMFFNAERFNKDISTWETGNGKPVYVFHSPAL